jgi:hypothetical protein
MSQKIRIKLKSYDHKLVDKSAEKIGKAVIDRTVTDEEILAAIEEINFSEEDAHE